MEQRPVGGSCWSVLDVGRPPEAAPYRRFCVLLPNGERYFTVLGSDDLRVREADEFLFQHLAQGGAEGTTESYAGAIALFLTWCAAAGIGIRDAARYLGRFTLWLRHYDPANPVIAAGPGGPAVRGASRINTVLAAVREFHKHLVAVQLLPTRTLDALYKVVDDRDLPDAVRGEHTGLRLEDVHLMPGRRTGCQTEGPHLHVIKRTNPNRAAAKSRRSRELPCDPLVVRLFDDWFAERDDIPGAADCDFVLVTLSGPRIGCAVRPGLINELFEELVRRAGLDRDIHPHMLHHSMISNVLDHGGTIDEAQALAGHANPETTASTYAHPATARLRAAVERVPNPRTGRQESTS